MKLNDTSKSKAATRNYYTVITKNKRMKINFVEQLEIQV